MMQTIGKNRSRIAFALIISALIVAVTGMIFKDGAVASLSSMFLLPLSGLLGVKDNEPKETKPER